MQRLQSNHRRRLIDDTRSHITNRRIVSSMRHPRACEPHAGEARASYPHAGEPRAGKPTLRCPADEGMAARKSEANVTFVRQVFVDAYHVLIDAYQVLIKSTRAAPTGGYLEPSLI